MGQQFQVGQSPYAVAAEPVDVAGSRTHDFLAGREPLFAERVADGHIVDGHGDLVADDVFCLDDGPRALALDALDQSAAGEPAGSHAVSLGSTVSLGRALDRLPGRLVVLAVSGTEFGFGQGLTPPVAAAVASTVERVCALVG